MSSWDFNKKKRMKEINKIKIYANKHTHTLHIHTYRMNI